MSPFAKLKLENHALWGIVKLLSLEQLEELRSQGKSDKQTTELLDCVIQGKHIAANLRDQEPSRS